MAGAGAITVDTGAGRTKSLALKVSFP